MLTRRRILICLFLLVATLAVWLFLRARWHSGLGKGDARLRAFAIHAPPVPIVFTSRSNVASLQAASLDGEGFRFPGQPQWQAEEGRLRLLAANGEVHELTWGRKFADGSTLIDVMSPSVSHDGKKVLFAGRKGTPDLGRFRIYEVALDGTGLRQITGGDGDEGCTALPPLRWAQDGNLLPPEERKRLDYDDVDPVYLNEDWIAFVSSRTPDLGRDHSRRATHLWVMKRDGSEKRQVSANRNNDRWPGMMPDGSLMFSMWSRNREVIDGEGKGLAFYAPGRPSLTWPTNTWEAIALDPHIMRLLVKLDFPAWRIRPLFSGRYVFMTHAPHALDRLPGVLSTMPGPGFPGGVSFAGMGFETLGPLEKQGTRLTIAQVLPPIINIAPSATEAAAQLPELDRLDVQWGPAFDENGRLLSLATPSPCPSGEIVLAASSGEPEDFGIFIMSDQWPSDLQWKAGGGNVAMQKLFDDPDLVDAEPVAAYPRPISRRWESPTAGTLATPSKMQLEDGSVHVGAVGGVTVQMLGSFDLALDGRSLQTSSRTGSWLHGPGENLITSIHVYASQRDRFDDADRPRVPGELKLWKKAPVDRDNVSLQLPATAPFLLLGMDAEGKVARWKSKVTDPAGRYATFFAYAGDHYSGVRPGHVNACLGCHPGHSATDASRIPREAVRK